MHESRRTCLRTLAGAALAFLASVAAARSQDPRVKDPTAARPDDDPNFKINGKPLSKIRLEEDQKDIKNKLEKLFDLATQLKEQVEKTDATAVLSLAMVKKAEEIERLARSIKERAKG